MSHSRSMTPTSDHSEIDYDEEQFDSIAPVPDANGLYPSPATTPPPDEDASPVDQVLSLVDQLSIVDKTTPSHTEVMKSVLGSAAAEEDPQTKPSVSITTFGSTPAEHESPEEQTQPTIKKQPPPLAYSERADAFLPMDPKRRHCASSTQYVGRTVYKWFRVPPVAKPNEKHDDYAGALVCEYCANHYSYDTQPILIEWEKLHTFAKGETLYCSSMVERDFITMRYQGFIIQVGSPDGSFPFYSENPVAASNGFACYQVPCQELYTVRIAPDPLGEIPGTTKFAVDCQLNGWAECVSCESNNRKNPTDEDKGDLRQEFFMGHRRFSPDPTEFAGMELLVFRISFSAQSSRKLVRFAVGLKCNQPYEEAAADEDYLINKNQPAVYEAPTEQEQTEN